MVILRSFLLITAFAAGCGAVQMSDIKLGNGVELKEEVDESIAVVMLEAPRLNGFQGYCSGTLLNDTTVMTAAHCLLSSTTGGFYLKLRNGQHIKSIKAFVNPLALEIGSKVSALESQIETLKVQSPTDEQRKKREELEDKRSDLLKDLTTYDVALAVMPKGTGDNITGGKNYYGIAPDRPNADNRVLLIGYGNNEIALASDDPTGDKDTYRGFGVKRRGTNTLTKVNGNQLEMLGYLSAEEAKRAGLKPGDEVSALPGDSGGPWILCSNPGSGTGTPTNDCGNLKMVGVSSTVAYSHLVMRFGINKSPDLTSDISRALYKTAIQCTRPPCAANFAGSGVASPPPEPNPLIKIAIVGRAGYDKMKLVVAAPQDIEQVQYCRGTIDTCKTSDTNYKIVKAPINRLNSKSFFETEELALDATSSTDFVVWTYSKVNGTLKVNTGTEATIKAQ